MLMIHCCQWYHKRWPIQNFISFVILCGILVVAVHWCTFWWVWYPGAPSGGYGTLVVAVHWCTFWWVSPTSAPILARADCALASTVMKTDNGIGLTWQNYAFQFPAYVLQLHGIVLKVHMMMIMMIFVRNYIFFP